MSRLSTHLPRLATLAAAMVAATASYCVHADRSASSAHEGHDQRAGPTAHSDKRRSAVASHGRQRRDRSTEHTAACGKGAQADHPAATSRSRFVSATAPSRPAHTAPSRPRKPESRRPHYAVRPHADRDAERAVNRELQRVIGEPAPMPAVPTPAPPTPSVPAPPVPSPPSSPPTNQDANPKAGIAVPAPDVDTTVPVPVTASPVAPAAPSSPPQEPLSPLQAGTDQVIPHGA
jgi:hypothetical protein